jgi:hypothetical protein
MQIEDASVQCVWWQFMLTAGTYCVTHHDTVHECNAVCLGDEAFMYGVKDP